MKVLMVSTSFPASADDGTSLFLLHRARDIQRLGCNIRVLAPAGPGKPPGETEVGGISLKRFSFPGWRTSRLVYGAGMAENLKRNDARRAVGSFVAGMLRAMRTEMRSADIIDAQWLGTGAAAMAASAIDGGKKSGRAGGGRIPLVVTAHRLSDGRIWRYTNRFVMAGADCTVFCSRFLEERAHAQFKVRRSEVVYPAFRTAASSEDEDMSLPPGIIRDAPILLAIGRMVEKKGFTYLVKAASRVLRSHRCTFLLGGDGPEKGKIQSMVSDLGIGDHFKILGRISPRRIWSLYRSVDIFVMPSIQDRFGEIETFGAVLAEAMSAELPVVGFSSGSIPELIENGVNGYLVPEKDEVALAESIRLLLDSPDLCDRCGSASREKAKTVLNPEIQAEKLTGIYRELIR